MLPPGTGSKSAFGSEPFADKKLKFKSGRTSPVSSISRKELQLKLLNKDSLSIGFAQDGTSLIDHLPRALQVGS